MVGVLATRLDWGLDCVWGLACHGMMVRQWDAMPQMASQWVPQLGLRLDRTLETQWDLKLEWLGWQKEVLMGLEWHLLEPWWDCWLLWQWRAPQLALWWGKQLPWSNCN